jgi:hypothetical protein
MTRSSIIQVGRPHRDRGIYVGRPTPLGNPFRIGAGRTPAQAVSGYREYFPTLLRENAAARRQFEGLVGAARVADIVLLCWCRSTTEQKPECHADVIAEAVATAVQMRT